MRKQHGLKGETLGGFLVIAGSGIGNVLLATPLIRSLRRAHPGSRIDVLVPQGRGGVLEGNPDISEIVEEVRGQGIPASARFVRRLWRQYDWVLSARAGDRSIISAWMGGRGRVSHVQCESSPRVWQKLLLDGWVGADAQTHAVIHGLRLLDGLGVPRCYDVVPPVCPERDRQSLDELLPFCRADQPYAVMHFYPRNRYKCWTSQGWARAIRHLAGRGLRVLLTGGRSPAEQQYIKTVLAEGNDPPVVNLTGVLNLQQVGDLLSRCALYLGPDTGVTHLAASYGIPTVALYGPTSPVYWGPWPMGYGEDRSPFVRRGLQRVGNVSIVQSDLECVGCGKEGCSDDPSQPSRCMQELRAETVVSALDEAMTEPCGGGASTAEGERE